MYVSTLDAPAAFPGSVARAPDGGGHTRSAHFLAAPLPALCSSALRLEVNTEPSPREEEGQPFCWQRKAPAYLLPGQQRHRVQKRWLYCS